IATDREAGFTPFAVVATVGTTSVTAVDPVNAIADVCARDNVWLHVDAAYGGAAAVLDSHRWVLAGCDRADSVVVNPHKWLFTPIDCSVLYCAREDLLKRAFSITPAYLATSEGPGVRNLMDYGSSLGRRFRGLKLWFVLRAFGIEGAKARIAAHIDMARHLREWIEADPDCEVLRVGLVDREHHHRDAVPGRRDHRKPHLRRSRVGADQVRGVHGAQAVLLGQVGALEVRHASHALPRGAGQRADRAEDHLVERPASLGSGHAHAADVGGELDACAVLRLDRPGLAVVDRVLEL